MLIVAGIRMCPNAAMPGFKQNVTCTFNSIRIEFFKLQPTRKSIGVSLLSFAMQAIKIQLEYIDKG